MTSTRSAVAAGRPTLGHARDEEVGEARRAAPRSTTPRNARVHEAPRLRVEARGVASRSAQQSMTPWGSCATRSAIAVDPVRVRREVGGVEAQVVGVLVVGLQRIARQRASADRRWRARGQERLRGEVELRARQAEEARLAAGRALRRGSTAAARSNSFGSLARIASSACCTFMVGGTGAPTARHVAPGQARPPAPMGPPRVARGLMSPLHADSAQSSNKMVRTTALLLVALRGGLAVINSALALIEAGVRPKWSRLVSMDALWQGPAHARSIGRRRAGAAARGVRGDQRAAAVALDGGAARIGWRRRERRRYGSAAQLIGQDDPGNISSWARSTPSSTSSSSWSTCSTSKSHRSRACTRKASSWSRT